MKRKDFLKSIGTAGLGVMAVGKSASTVAIHPSSKVLPPACTLIPSETQGPYQLNLSNNSTIWRSNILEPGTDGSGAGAIPMTFVLTIQNLDCVPIPNLRVDFWHCNEFGYYSGFNGQNGFQGTKNYAGQTWMRGIQCTDTNGQVTFETIYPGWYVGRAHHIHFQIYSAGTCSTGSGWSLERTSQIAFPNSVNTTVNNTSPYSQHGQNPTTNENDNVFSDGYGLELATMSGSPSSGYTGILAAAINFTIIPLELVSFQGGRENGKTALWWTTLSESNLSHFELERSTDGKTFVTLGEVAARNTLGPNNYRFSDLFPVTGTAYYRLKSVELDGRFEYNDMVAIDNKLLSEVSISPMPASDFLLLKHPQAFGNYSVRVMAMDGRTVATGQMPEGTNETRLDVSLLRSGLYLLLLENGVDRHVVQFVKR